MQDASIRRVLVADDNADAAQTFALLLSFSGHEVRIAHDGDEALAVGRDFHPDVAFLDIGMPRMDGYELAGRMRAEEWGREVTLIALTGHGGHEARIRAHDAGFDRHLTKPIDPQEVQSLLTASVPRAAQS
jgi:CheY-like chemotaxis protein